MVNMVNEDLNNMSQINKTCVQKGECSHECVAIIEKQLGKLINTEIVGSTEELEDQLLDISDDIFYNVWDNFINTKMDFKNVVSMDNKFKVVDVYDKNNNVISISLNYITKEDKIIFTEVLTEVIS